MTSMAPHQNAPRDQAGAHRDNDPDQWTRMAAVSPPNPWGDGRASRKGRASRVIAVVVLLFGVLLFSAALSYGLLSGSGNQAAADSGEATLSLGATPSEQVPASDATRQSAGPSGAEDPTPVAPVVDHPAAGQVVDTPSAEAEVEPAEDPVDAGPTANLAEPTAAVPVPGRFRAPGEALQCAANVNWRIYAGTEATSCPFAENVAIAMAGNAGTTTSHQVAAHSPVTSREYQVSCTTEGGGSFTCRGGQGAEVILEHRDDT